MQFPAPLSISCSGSICAFAGVTHSDDVVVRAPHNVLNSKSGGGGQTPDGDQVPPPFGSASFQNFVIILNMDSGTEYAVLVSGCLGISYIKGHIDWCGFFFGEQFAAYAADVGHMVWICKILHLRGSLRDINWLKF